MAFTSIDAPPIQASDSLLERSPLEVGTTRCKAFSVPGLSKMDDKTLVSIINAVIRRVEQPEILACGTAAHKTFDYLKTVSSCHGTFRESNEVPKDKGENQDNEEGKDEDCVV